MLDEYRRSESAPARDAASCGGEALHTASEADFSSITSSAHLPWSSAWSSGSGRALESLYTSYSSRSSSEFSPSDAFL